MLASRGSCHAVFLLAHAARLRQRRHYDEWVEAAQARSTYMTLALDLDAVAKNLLALGLVTSKEHIATAESLRELSHAAHRSTLVGIAKVLLLSSPPSWLDLVVSERKVLREYIPIPDMEALEWLGDDLDSILLDLHNARAHAYQANVAKKIGDTAELFLLAAFRKAGTSPLHVAKISDHYGYDIECPARRVDRIEVKAASPKTKMQFHITRNEYEKSIRYGSEWRLLQVVFSYQAFISEKLNSTHVEEILELQPGMLKNLVPADTDTFRWEESALITAPASAWRPAPLALDPLFELDGFYDRRI